MDRRWPRESRELPSGPSAKGRKSAAMGEPKKQGQKRARRGSEKPATPTESAEITVAPQRLLSVPQGPRTVPKRPMERGVAGLGGRKVRPVLKLLNGILTLIVVALLGVGGTVYYMQAAVDSEGPLAEAKLLVVPRNDGTQDIAERLEKQGIVGDKRMFLAGLYTMRAASLMPGGRTFNLKAGQYEIKPHASIRSIVETLSEGRAVLTKITIPEGLTSYQIVERLKADQSLSGDVREIPAEGTLLPETYSLPGGSPRQTLIDMMQAAQKKLIDQLWAERQEKLPLKTPAEAVTLASIVEKETGRNDERDRVSGVFVNRLRKGMKIQSDPTILYGLAQGKVRWGKTIYASDKNSRTAHNTYFISGLPPTPICNPGRAALEATLKPAATPDLYFVANGQGGHVFATTLKDHDANVLKWRQIERERVAVQSGAAAPLTTGAPIPVTNTLNAPPVVKPGKQP